MWIGSGTHGIVQQTISRIGRSNRMAEPDTGGTPDGFAECTECGTIFTAHISEEGELRPIGIDGVCECGNAEFNHISET